MAARSDPAAAAKVGNMPVFIIHARDDEVVPFGPAEALADEMQARGQTVSFLPLEGVGHFRMGAAPLKDGGEWVLERWAERGFEISAAPGCPALRAGSWPGSPRGDTSLNSICAHTCRRESGTSAAPGHGLVHETGGDPDRHGVLCSTLGIARSSSPRDATSPITRYHLERSSRVHPKGLPHHELSSS